MKLLLITKTEMDTLNIQFLLKNHIMFAYTYEDFLSKLHDNVDTVGFTTKAIHLMSTSSKFINLLKGIRILYGYKYVYFTEDDTDGISRYLNTQKNAYVAMSLVKCSEFDIKTQLDRDELKTISYEAPLGLDSSELPTLLGDVERNTQGVLDILNSKPKMLKDILTLATRINSENHGLSREISVLLSQKIHLLELSAQISDENERLVNLLKKLESINEINYGTLCSYKSRYEEYKDSLDTVLNHGLANLKEDLNSTIKVDNPTYPLCVIYLKEVTHLNYLSSYITSLLKILLDKHMIGKFIRILPKNSSTKLKKYSNHVNTTYGIDPKTYSAYSKFVHLGNPHQILEFMLSNRVPVDVVIILDETALDNQFCYGDSVVKYYLGNSDTDLEEYDLDTDSSIVNSKFGNSGAQLLGRYKDFHRISTDPKLTKVFHEKLPLTQTLLTNIKDVLYED